MAPKKIKSTTKGCARYEELTVVVEKAGQRGDLIPYIMVIDKVKNSFKKRQNPLLDKGF